MKFFAQLASKSTIHTDGDRMELDKENNMLYVYNGDKLVCALDIGVVLIANFHE